jgi:TATA-box binding protein (TBP) (component of TFIID and TFIIIB)|tara:strand:+ start:366 stop:881 length:516 start_codon:yes stop_codon:yes gene_type:complete
MTETSVENQLFRFNPAIELDPQRVVDELGGKRSGQYVMLSLVTPRATLLVDHDGKIIVHGCRKQDIAHLAAKEVMLRLGEQEAGMTFEVGPVVASFDFDQTVSLERVPDLFPEAVMDTELDCLRIDDKKHEIKLLLFRNGRGIATEARHRKLVAMAARRWKQRLSDENLLD